MWHCYQSIENNPNPKQLLTQVPVTRKENSQRNLRFILRFSIWQLWHRQIWGGVESLLGDNRDPSSRLQDTFLWKFFHFHRIFNFISLSAALNLSQHHDCIIHKKNHNLIAIFAILISNLSLVVLSLFVAFLDYVWLRYSEYWPLWRWWR